MAAPITQAQIAIVKSTAPVLKLHGEAITTLFYKTLIDENPSLRDYFSTTSQATGAQPRALAHAVVAYATFIDDLPALSHAVERISQKHVSLQISPPQYALVGKYLIWAVGQVLGDAATPAVVDAWTAAYGALADVFIGREKTLYEENKKRDRWEGWRKFKVARREAENEAEGITSFYFAPGNGEDGAPLPRYLPGQYVSVQLFVPELGHLQSRQYSLSEGPRADQAYYRVSIKREDGVAAGIPGLVSNRLHDGIQVGDEVELSHPQGEFTVDPLDKAAEGVPAVLISAGVGATALMSILDALTPGEGKPDPVRRPVSWLHVSRSGTLLPFGKTVRDICAANENVSSKVFLTGAGPEEQECVHYDFAGRLHLEKLDKERDLHVGDARSQYYLCGSEQFMKDVRKGLIALGVNADRIHMELFDTGDVNLED